MSLVVEDGTVQDATPESYASVSDTDTYISRWHDSSAWASANTAEKERALLKATRFIDSHNFVGQVTDPDQALSWPRGFVGAVDGRVVASDEIPRRVKEATMEAAMRVVEGDTLQPDHDGGTIKRERKQIGSLSKDTEFASPRGAGKTFSVIRALLRPYLQTSRGLQKAI